jgi:hypothetical protein
MPTPDDRPPLQRRSGPASAGFGCGPADAHRVVVDAVLRSGGIVTPTCRGTSVAAREDHPAFGRW